MFLIRRWWGCIWQWSHGAAAPQPPAPSSPAAARPSWADESTANLGPLLTTRAEHGLPRAPQRWPVCEVGAFVKVGDVINAEEGDYRRGSVPAHQDSMRDLHLRVTRVSMDAGAYDTEWVTVRGVEKPLGKPELPEAEFAIRRRVLADIERPAPAGPVW